MARLFVLLQFALPKRGLSNLVGWLTRLRGGRVTQWAIALFVRIYRVEMSEAACPDPAGYVTFNEFFTRALDPAARVLAPGTGVVVSPADGVVSEFGALDGERLLQAKGITYSVLDLFDGDRTLAARFNGGTFVTVYLAPRDYHRVHMPLDGLPVALRYIPGALFSVNASTTHALRNLFCRNERAATVFRTDAGAFALVMVGAMNVGSIELCLPQAAPFRNRPWAAWPSGITHTLDTPALARGSEYGRFNMGSTVIMIASAGLMTFAPDIAVGRRLQVGQAIAQC